MTEPGLRRKVVRLMLVRAIIGTILLGSAIFMEVTAPGSFPVNPYFFLIGCTYALTIIYVLTLRYIDRYRWLVDLQLAIDALIVSAFIYITGGITSYFTSLYVLPVIAASTIQFRRGGLMVATLSAVLYAGLVLAQYLAASGLRTDPWLISMSVVLPPVSVARYTAALNMFGFFAVALLSGSLANSLRSAGVQLEQASSEIADLQALNQHVIDSLPSGLATTDPAHRILTFNRGAEAITGVPFRDAVGRPVYEVLQLPPVVMHSVQHELRVKGARRHEFRYRPSDGRSEREIGLTATYLETPGGRAGLIFTFQDVTAIKKMERDSAIQQRLAAVGEMAAGIAHEIRNPLASMSGSIQILRQELPLSSEQEQLMDIVLRESERLNTTIRSFLAYARPQRFQIARFDVRRVLNDTALLLRNSNELRDGHEIQVSLPDSELWYDADEGQIKQIVWNLATNGLRAMPNGGRLQLVAEVEASEGVVLTVRDEGVGIPPEELDSLFQPFHGTFAKGSGLGLAIVHRIVADYQGEIRVSSKPGAGTTVSVRLPARTPAVVS
ncbi:MAG: PAS domain-containing protein [Acidobacteria bacterium]|nr:PAS domain-containing protein [Acidobacteriota bacterium]